MDQGLKTKRAPNPRENAFPLSSATFFYTIPTFIKGFKKELDESDLTETLSEHKSSKLGNKIEKCWKDEEQRAAKANSVPSLKRVLFRMFGWEFMFYGLVLAFSEAIRIAQPIVLGQLIAYFAVGQTDIPQSDAYLYAAGVVGCSLLNVLFTHPYMLGVFHLGMKMRVACCSLIYRKALKLSKTALGQTTAGQVVNLLSNDVNRFDVSLIFAHQLWVGPLETLACTYFMYMQVSEAAAIGVLVLIMFVPIQIYLGKRISIFRLTTALRTDERVRLMNEIISGIQVIKMYAWEKPFASLVARARRYEIKTIRYTSFMRGIIYSFIMYSTRMSIFACILAYVLLGNSITAEKVFVITSFYNILRQTMAVFFPQGIAQIAEANVSINRLNKFLLYDETQIAKMIRASEQKNLEQSGTIKKEKLVSGEKGVFLSGASAKWTEASTESTLQNINLTATPGKLVAIIGPVGAGKTSLFHAILKELPLTEGKLRVEGEISYASQEPWLFSGSVRQNILFGSEMDKVRYKNVVKKCALERDFTLLPYGDKTLVGDRGVGLSGGQRARINLARAVYKQADIYLLDDPLSAVDSHVGKQLFEECITGYLKNKTVILITHQLQYLQHVDHIVFLDNGIIRAQGTFEELQKSGFDFTKLLATTPDEDKKEDESELKRQGSIKSISSIEDAPLQMEEHKSVGSVGAKIYNAYFKAGGSCCFIFVLFALFFLAQVLGSGADYFLSYWVNLEERNDTHYKETYKLNSSIFNLQTEFKLLTESDDIWDFSRETCIFIYTGLIGGLVLIALIRSFTFFSFCMRASTNLHDSMFECISRTTMRFFDTNNAGRILNRFSKDMGAIDELLPAALIDVLQIGLTLSGIVVVVAVVSPWLIIPTAFIGIIFYFLRIFYIRTSRNIKRLEGITRSPVFGHLNASLQGLTTIRAFRAEEILSKEFDNHQDLHSSAWFVFISTSRAFGYWLDLICVIYVFLVTFSFLLIGNEQFGGNVGLAITQAIGITGMFQWGMRQSTELENQMTSVERVVEYSSIESEGALDSTPDKKPSISWPEHGEVEFKNVYLRYAPDDPPVLRNLSFLIKPKEKVGIVGRTGAGKSSLINALFQLTETEGAIIIDGVDITKIGLHDLRKKISIIPQEPVIFSGTMRKNLDPFNEYTDDELWRALEEVELKEAVNDLPCGLDSVMSEGGSNFSVGQRQLVCLARAILRNNKVLVLDEATANVDPQTDVLIQTTIRKKFANCTVLTIAHRLHTVMDSDKVLVMDAGTMKEFGHPYELLQNDQGIFYGMVQQTGRAMAENLERIAKESFENH